jgi:PEGA domain
LTSGADDSTIRAHYFDLEDVMKRCVLLSLAAVVAATVLFSPSANAEPKKKVYNNSAEDVFKAALRTARERHVVTYVDEKTLMITFETGRSFTSEGFVANASVEAEGDNKATLIINVQNKRGLSWGAGDRMAEKFYLQVGDELAGDSKQKSAVKAQATAISVPDPKAVPAEPSMTKPAETASSVADDKGRVIVSSMPDGADVYVDDAFVGNAPATLRLAPGKHTVKVSQQGFKDWSKEISVFAGSEVGLKASLAKN